jgi:hypothetical protein
LLLCWVILSCLVLGRLLGRRIWYRDIMEAPASCHPKALERGRQAKDTCELCEPWVCSLSFPGAANFFLE